MKQLDVTDLHPYQLKAIRHALDHPATALWLDMGLGKTICTLMALMDLFDRMQSFGALVIAPRRVAETVWRQEAAKWFFTQGLTFSRVMGTPEQRSRALRRPAQIYLINYENLQWLIQEIEAGWLSKGLYPPFDTVVMDEISRLKSTRVQQGSKRGNALLRLMPYIKRRIGLTGTPAANGLLDLFGQYLCLDSGERLGTSYEAYKREYFFPTDWNGYAWAPFRHSEGEIRDKIGDITISMSNEDYLQLPPLMVNDIHVDLPQRVRMAYDKMERDFLLEFDSGHALELTTEASKMNRCLQVAGGACYKAPGEPEFESFHDAKLEALDEIVEEAAGSPILLAYQFQHEARRIIKKYPYARWINSGLNEQEMLQLQDDWNEGKVPMLIGHPASMGHGLNLQAGGSTLVWFGLNWSQDLYSQTNARLRRQGQTKPVIVHRIMTRNTLDEAQRLSLLEKQVAESSIRNAIQIYRSQKGESPNL